MCGGVCSSSNWLNLYRVCKVMFVVVVVVVFVVVVVRDMHGWVGGGGGGGLGWSGASGKWLMPPRITGYCKLVIVVLVAARPTVVMSRRGNE